MIELHEDEEIYLPTFKPEIRFGTGEERYMGRRKMAEFRKKHLVKRENTGILSKPKMSTNFYDQNYFYQKMFLTNFLWSKMFNKIFSLVNFLTQFFPIKYF